MEEEQVETVETTEVDAKTKLIREKRAKGKKGGIGKKKKDRESPLVKAIRLCIETGKVTFGFRKSLKSKSKPKLILVADNIPQTRSEELHALGVPVLVFDGSAKALAAVCGKPFLVSSLSVFDEGNSGLLKFAKK